MKNRTLTYGACYVLLNEEDYIVQSLASIYKWATKIYILLGEPFEDNVNVVMDSTKELVIRFPDPEGKIRIMESDEKDESNCKNYLKSLCEKDGLDYCWIVDGDEVYDERILPQFFNTLNREKKKFDTVLYGGLEYWRSIHHVTKIDRHYNMFICDKNKPIRIRSPGYDFKSLTLPENRVIYHHYGLAKTPKRIKEKYLTTKAREREDTKFNLNDWMENKFLAWKDNRKLTDLYPFRKNVWKSTTKLPDSAIPFVMRNHKWYGIDCIEN